VFVGVALIVAGVALVGVTAWFWSSARPDNPVLAPLEVMGDDAYKNADEETRKELLRQARAEAFARSDDDCELR
jgi:hypothetical protein